MKTAYKILFINIIIALGVGAIIWIQWPEAMKSHSIGAGYEQGLGARLFLAALMTGIPMLIYAVFAHVTLSHWLFKPDELKAYRARRLVEGMSGQGHARTKKSTIVRNAIMWLVIASGVAGIFFEAWKHIDARYAGEGPVAEGFMMVIVAGIPSITLVAVVSLAFRALFGVPADALPSSSNVPKGQPQLRSDASTHDFAD